MAPEISDWKMLLRPDSSRAWCSCASAVWESAGRINTTSSTVTAPRLSRPARSSLDPQEVSKVCWDHPLAFLKGPLKGASDPRIVTMILLAVVGVLYFLLR